MRGLVDSTLREGEQMAGVRFNPAQKAEVVRGVASVGIEEIEIGVASREPEMAELMARARSDVSGARIALWCRGIARDVEAGVALRPDVLSVCLPVSDAQVRRRLRRSLSWVLRQMKEAVDAAREARIEIVSLGLEDATRADPEFLREVLATARRLGVDRVRLADTMGITDPLSIASLVRESRRYFRGEIGVHAHNDFGMATANTIAALDAGADWADVTVLGLGERAGNARLEEVVAFLTLIRKRKGYRLPRLNALCRTVASAAALAIPPRHTLLGDAPFIRDAGRAVGIPEA